MEQLRIYAYENGGVCPRRYLRSIIEASAARICLVMASIHAPRGKKYKITDFMPQTDMELNEEDEVAAVDSLLKGLAGSAGVTSTGKSGIKWRRKASARGL